MCYQEARELLINKGYWAYMDECSEEQIIAFAIKVKKGE
jgi:hypothetical protein